jgi:hypothetical protein
MQLTAMTIRRGLFQRPHPIIDITPVDESCFMPLLLHLTRSYHFPMPPVTDRITGYFANFKIAGKWVSLDVDTYDFMLIFKDVTLRDRVLAYLMTVMDTVCD